MQLNWARVMCVNKKKREHVELWTKVGSSRAELLVKRIYGEYLGYKTKILFSWKSHKVRRSPSVLSTSVAVTYGMMIPRAQSTHKVYMPLRYVRSYVPWDLFPGENHISTRRRAFHAEDIKIIPLNNDRYHVSSRGWRYTYSFRLHGSMLRTK